MKTILLAWLILAMVLAVLKFISDRSAREPGAGPPTLTE
jgi:hypothetical protein